MYLVLDRKKIILLLIVVAILLIIIHSVILGIYYYIGDPVKFNFIRMFDLDMERNIPTLFSSLLLAVSSLAFFLLSKSPCEKEELKNKYWLGLSFIFIFLSFDESVKIHEKLGDFTERFVDASGYLNFPWVIIYSIFITILGFIYFKFFWNMGKQLFFSFMLAAFIFLSGALGFELLGANESSLNGTNSILYSVFYTIEESLEMFGVIYLIWILLGLLEKEKIVIK